MPKLINGKIGVSDKSNAKADLEWPKYTSLFEGQKQLESLSIWLNSNEAEFEFWINEIG